MMPIPALPTDSLYKFMSVAGVVGALGSCAALLWLVNQVAAEQIAARTEIRARSEELLRHSLELHEVEFRIASDSANWSAAAIKAQEQKLAALQRRTESIAEEVKAREGFEKRARASRTPTLSQAAEFCGFFIVGFVSIAMAGFFLWWINVQRHQDGILECEHARVRRELVPVSHLMPPG